MRPVKFTTPLNALRIVSLAALLPAVASGATILALWEMNTAFPTGTGNVPTGNSYSPPNSSYLAGTPSSGALAGNNSAILSAYHAVSATTYTSPSGNGSTYSFSTNNWTTGDYYQVVLPTTGYTNLTLSWDQARSSTGPASFRLKQSTDGTTFTNLLDYTVLQSGGGGAPGTWTAGTYNSLYTFSQALSASADNQGTLYLRFESLVTSATSGANRIDNIQISAVSPGGASGVPETASTTGLLLLGLGGLGLAARPRRRGRTR